MEARPGSEAGGPAGTGRAAYAGDDEHGMRWDRIAAVAALIFVALAVVTFFTPSTPTDSNDSAEQLAAAISDQRAGHQLSLLLGFLGDIAFLVFLAGLWSRFRRHEGGGGMMSGLFAIAGAAFVGTILLTEGLYLAYVQAAESADPSVLPTMAVLDDWVGIAVIPAAVAMLIGATGAILSTHALPVWMGYLAGLDAVLLLLSLSAVFAEDEDNAVLAGIGAFGGFLLFLVWALAAGVLLLMGTRRHAAIAA